MNPKSEYKLFFNTENVAYCYKHQPNLAILVPVVKSVSLLAILTLHELKAASGMVVLLHLTSRK